jgi:NOL1/NOP2/fmu family ribosome biogenesis protein
MGLPPGNWILNTRDRKRLLQTLHDQFGIEELPWDDAYIQNAKEKVFVINRDLERVPYERMRIDSLGLYLGTWQADGFRLSMEGAQLLAPYATKNTVSLDDERRNRWLKGEDLPWHGEGKEFVIVTHEGTGDTLGCGKIRQPREGKDEDVILLNYTPKARRLIVVNE